MSESFEGKVAFVTGAASGIGRATAELFAARGAKVAVADLESSASGGAETVDAIKQAGGEAIFVPVDVSDEQQVAAAIAKTIDPYGRLDCAFNNAGIEGESAPTADCTLENFNRVISVNLTGIFLCMKYELPHLIETGGSIVNCASIAGIVAFAGSPAYCASKGGVIQLTRTAAMEYAGKVRVNAVLPGVIETPMIDRAVAGNEEMSSMLTMGEPIGRLGEPNEIAEAVVFLASDGASFVTGHPMVVDGGWVAR